MIRRDGQSHIQFMMISALWLISGVLQLSHGLYM